SGGGISIGKIVVNRNEESMERHGSGLNGGYGVAASTRSWNTFWRSHTFWRQRQRNELLTAISFERPVGPRVNTKADASDEEDHDDQADCTVGIELAGIRLHGPGVGAGVGQRLL